MTFTFDINKTAHFTGQRPQHLRGLELEAKYSIDWLIEYARERGIDTFISGAAAGVDMWAAEAVMKLIESGEDIKLILAIPFVGHNAKWPESSKRAFQAFLERMKKYGDRTYAFTLAEEGFSVKKLNDRNRWMAENASICLGVWDGKRIGGTSRQLTLSSNMGLHTVFVNPWTQQMYRLDPDTAAATN